MVVKTGGVEETKVLNYRFTKEMNNLGRCVIILDDVDYSGDGIGDMSAKYTPEDYAFKDIIIEEPAATVVWRGRIVKIQYTTDGQVVLHGEDWLGQYKDIIRGENLTGDPITRPDKTHPIPDGEVNSVDSGTERVYPKAPYNNMGNDQYNGLFFFLKTGTAGAKHEHIYPDQFDVKPQCFDGGDIDFLFANDWDNVLANRRSYALCAKSGTVFDSVWLEVKLKTRFDWDTIFASDVDIDVACHIRGGDVGSSALQIYNFDTETWDNLATGDCNHDYETQYDNKSKNYVSSDGLIRIKATATQASLNKYIIFDYLKVKVNASTTNNPRLYKIQDTVFQAGNSYLVLDDFDASEIAANDQFVVTYPNAYIVNSWLGEYDYKHALTREIAEDKYPRVFYTGYTTYFESLLDCAKQDGRDLYYRHGEDKVYFGKYVWQDKTLIEATDMILNVLSDVDGEKLINRMVVAGETGIDVLRIDPNSKAEYNDTWKTGILSDGSIGTETKAALEADAHLQTYARLYKNVFVTVAGLGDYELGDVVELTLNQQNIADFYLVRRLAYDWQKDETVIEFGKIPQQPTKKYDDVWDKLREMLRRITNLELRIV